MAELTLKELIIELESILIGARHDIPVEVRVEGNLKIRKGDMVYFDIDHIEYQYEGGGYKEMAIVNLKVKDG